MFEKVLEFIMYGIEIIIFIENVFYVLFRDDVIKI